MPRSDLYAWIGEKWAKITCTEQDGKYAADVNVVNFPAGVTDVGLDAGENHIGEVGGNSEQLAAVIANTVDTYTVSTSSVVVGIPVNISNAMRKNGGKGVITRLSVIDTNNQKGNLLILFFSANPTGTYTNKSAPVIGSDFAANLLGTVAVNSSDYNTIGGAAVAGIPGQNIVLKSAADSKDIYMVVLATATVAYSAANALTVKVHTLRD